MKRITELNNFDDLLAIAQVAKKRRFSEADYYNHYKKNIEPRLKVLWKEKCWKKDGVGIR